MFKTDNNRKGIDLYAWPGGYQLSYLVYDGCRDNETGRVEVNPYDKSELVCCGKCAQNTNEWPDIIVITNFVHWEGEPLQCEFCNEMIESEYGIPEVEAT